MAIVRVYLIALIIFLIDQLSKYYVVHILNLVELLSIDVIPPIINFRMAWNEGINFGLFGSSSLLGRLVLITISFIIIVCLSLWIRNGKKLTDQICVGFIIGGAVGNLFDRILYGAVADFLNMSCCGISNPFSFNIADIAIFLGAVGLIFMNSNKVEQEN